ncbi:hypothetical protein RHGRI_004875 [Rhododendron griersonianum]|uniref:Uncharacterized protein n=1 Tax=Rhododendron griersonianum TaxID=479676 RepID=A0AAV6LAL2_9ERIC|nr:hypothetical protein RHGRI_004875 [Rhododendron griersonianum]KAG5561982.1 hypothetical protein RHGRI_004875 [Rhododendron griersonianum]
MSSVVEQGYGVGSVIFFLWFKRSLPRYCTNFIEICIMFCADHRPCVSGAQLQGREKILYPALLQVSNEDVLAKICFPRALFSKRAQLKCRFETDLLTIGPQFGEAVDDAARYFNEAYDKGLSPYEFLENMKKKGIRMYARNWPQVYSFFT